MTKNSINTPYNYLIFVCTNERAPNNPRGCCKDRGGEEILKTFKNEIKSQGLKKHGVRATRSGCLDFCEEGANVVVYGNKVTDLGGVWYKNVKPDDVIEIINSHIIKDKPITRLINTFDST